MPPVKEFLALPVHKENPAQSFSFAEKPTNKQDLIFTTICDSNIELSDIEYIKKDNRNISESLNPIKKGYCYHVGILIFAPFLSMLKKSGLGACKPYVIQWLVSVLLGAKNIEQSKLLNYKSLNFFLGQATRNLHVQRKKLKEFAIENNIDELLNFNAGLVGVDNKTDFYYDPHTKHYTGLRKILKSWCSKVRIADKVINTDFIHTTDGFPVYLNNGDTFDDMRIRFFKDVKRFRKISNMPDRKEITMCVDRGIFSSGVFDEIIKLENLHIITWEKAYKKDMWDEKFKPKPGFIIKVRNNKRDTKLISYVYQEYKWGKNDKIRQLIVRLPEKSGTGFLEVSILTDDFLRDAVQIINLIINRWIQENDFKYLIAHFGLDQITSYLFDSYNDITDTITDKEHVSGEYKALTKELEKLGRKLKTSLHKKHQFDNKFGIYQDIATLTKRLTNEPIKKLIEELISELAQMQTEKITKIPTKKQKESYKKNLIKIVELSKKYHEKEQERAKTKKYVSKIKELTKNEIQKLNTNPKQFMDIIKIIAHNIFYLGFESFKEKYDNYRDDHLIFRAITRSDGIIEKKNSEMIINISPAMEIYPKQKSIFSEIFNEINKQNITLPGNFELKIRLDITEKTNSFFAFAN